jgi:hypothetical protein
VIVLSPGCLPSTRRGDLVKSPCRAGGPRSAARCHRCGRSPRNLSHQTQQGNKGNHVNRAKEPTPRWFGGKAAVGAGLRPLMMKSRPSERWASLLWYRGHVLARRCFSSRDIHPPIINRGREHGRNLCARWDDLPPLRMNLGAATNLA